MSRRNGLISTTGSKAIAEADHPRLPVGLLVPQVRDRKKIIKNKGTGKYIPEVWNTTHSDEIRANHTASLAEASFANIDNRIQTTSLPLLLISILDKCVLW